MVIFSWKLDRNGRRTSYWKQSHSETNQSQSKSTRRWTPYGVPYTHTTSWTYKKITSTTTWKIKMWPKSNASWNSTPPGISFQHQLSFSHSRGKSSHKSSKPATSPYGHARITHQRWNANPVIGSDTPTINAEETQRASHVANSNALTHVRPTSV